MEFIDQGDQILHPPVAHGFWPSLSAQERARGSRALGLLPSVQFPPFKHFQISPSKTNNWYNTRWRADDAHSLRSVHWSVDRSFVNSQNKTSRFHPVRRHPTSTGDASPASCQPMSWNSIGPIERFLVCSVFWLAWSSFLPLTTDECYWTADSDYNSDFNKIGMYNYCKNTTYKLNVFLFFLLIIFSTYYSIFKTLFGLSSLLYCISTSRRMWNLSRIYTIMQHYTYFRMMNWFHLNWETLESLLVKGSPTYFRESVLLNIQNSHYLFILFIIIIIILIIVLILSLPRYFCP